MLVINSKWQGLLVDTAMSCTGEAHSHQGPDLRCLGGHPSPQKPHIVFLRHTSLRTDFHPLILSVTLDLDFDFNLVGFCSTWLTATTTIVRANSCWVITLGQGLPILTTFLRGRYCSSSSLFSDEEPETQRGEIICNVLQWGSGRARIQTQVCGILGPIFLTTML